MLFNYQDAFYSLLTLLDLFFSIFTPLNKLGVFCCSLCLTKLDSTDYDVRDEPW